MHTRAPAIALFALLSTGAAFAHDDAHGDAREKAHDSTRSEHAAGHNQQQVEDDSAHGYQNPTGVDPDPRMDDHPAPSHDHDEEMND